MGKFHFQSGHSCCVGYWCSLMSPLVNNRNMTKCIKRDKRQRPWCHNVDTWETTRHMREGGGMGKQSARALKRGKPAPIAPYQEHLLPNPTAKFRHPIIRLIYLFVPKFDCSSNVDVSWPFRVALARADHSLQANLPLTTFIFLVV